MLTHRRHTRLVTVALSAGLLLLTAGCGSDEPADGPAAQGSGSAVPDNAALLAGVTTDAALAGKVPGPIRSAGALRVGSNVQSPPNNFYGADGKTPIGFEVDLVTAIGKRLDLTVAYQDMGFDALITSLQSGRVDLTIAGMNDTAVRQERITFVDYFTSGITIMVQKDNPAGIEASADLCGKTIAVVTGTSQEDFATAQSAECTAGGGDALQVTATDSDAQNQTQLRTGRVSAILNDLPSAVYISRTAGDGMFFQTVDQAPINGGPYGIGINKADPALAAAVQQALQSLIADGTYAEILSSWQITSGAVTTATINAG